MSVDIRVSRRRDTTVVTLAGEADARLLKILHDGLVAAMIDARLLVLDVDALTVVDPDGLRSMLRRLLESRAPGGLRLAARGNTIDLAAWRRIHELAPADDSIDVPRPHSATTNTEVS